MSIGSNVINKKGVESPRGQGSDTWVMDGQNRGTIGWEAEHEPAPRRGHAIEARSHNPGGREHQKKGFPPQNEKEQPTEGGGVTTAGQIYPQGVASILCSQRVWGALARNVASADVPA